MTWKMKYWKLFHLYLLLFLLCLPSVSLSEEIYKFERMWPTLQQPWYFSNLYSSIVVDKNGYIWITDYYNQCILKFNSNGEFLTKWGGKGFNDGQFSEIRDIALDAKDYVYVVDAGNNRIQKFTYDGKFVRKWGMSGKNNGQFLRPYSIATDNSGNVYVRDTTYRIQKFTSEGQFLTTWGSLGNADGQFLAAFTEGDPDGDIAIDNSGFLYVADPGNFRIQKFTTDGQFVIAWGNGDGGFGQYSHPYDIAVDNRGYVYVTERENGRILKFTSEGQSIHSWGGRGEGDGQFGYFPCSIASDGREYLYVMDPANSRVQKFTPDGMFLSKWGSSGTGAGEFIGPRGIAVIKDYVYVTDVFNNRIQKFTHNGQLVTKWGSSGNSDGQFRTPYGIAVDDSGYVYVTDYEHSRIQKFTSDGQFVTKWGSWGESDGQFKGPQGIAVDVNGYVYVADFNYRIQKFTSNGQFVTKWGSQGSGDGQFLQPRGVAVDKGGSVYVVDYGYNRIQKFTADGQFITKWESGDRLPWNPMDVGVDAQGDVYISDIYNHCIKKFTPDGQFITKIGLHGRSPGYLTVPLGIGISPIGSLYVADSDNNRIQVFRKVEIASNNKAIIVAGGGAYAGNDLWDATQMSANFSYRTLTYQGYTKEKISYLTSSNIDMDDNSVLDDVAGDATNTNLQNAITNWAKDADDVLVYLVDHGGNGSFRMNGNETLTATQLNAWLDTLQNSITGKVIVIYDACESGSFVTALRAPPGKQRIVITSTSPGESAYFITQGSVSFSNYFWTHIFNGVTIMDAFELTKEAIKCTTPYQNPLLDANGNGVANQAEDLMLIQNAYIGNGTLIQGSAPVITSVSSVPETLNNTKFALLSSDGVTDADGIARVWAVIRPPNYNQSNSDNPVQDLPSVDLMPVGNNRYEATYNAFTTTGTYQIAIYARDRIGNTSIPKVTNVSVTNPFSQKAIIVAGGSSNDVLWPAIQKGASLAYNALKFQDYRDDDIYFMSPVTYSVGVDGTATVSNLNYAITTWAATNTQDLTVYLIGNGDDGKFQISATETLNVSDLKTWLNALQNKIPGEVTVIYDAPRSGSFISALAPTPQGKQRIVLTSAGINQSAHYLSSGDVSFSKFFWSRVSNGTDIRDAFLHAKNAMSLLTASKQLAIMDDNGNGIGNEKDDGIIARNTSIGFGISLAADDPLIGSVSPEQTLTDGTTSALIWAESVTTTGTINKVWAVITPPSYSGSFLGAVTDLPSVTLTYNQYTSRYEGTFANFTTYGEYGIAIYALDADQNISLPSTTKVTQEAAPDKFEADNTNRQAKVIMLNDQDPNNTIEGYEKSQTHTFHKAKDEDWVVFSATAGNTYKVSANSPGSKCDPSIRIYGTDGITPLTSEVDDYGAGKAEYVEWKCPVNGVYYARVKQGTGSENVFGSDTQYQLTLTKPQAAFNGFIMGQVSPVVSLAKVSTGYDTALTLPNGYFFMPHIAGTFTLTVNADGYLPYSTGVTVGEMAVTTLTIPLTTLPTTTSIPGDLNGDGAVTVADAIIALQVMAGMQPVSVRTDFATSGADIGGDGKIASAELLYILQKTAGAR